MDASVIIPTFNRPLLLKQCLNSLFAQDYPRDDFEIIIIDDGLGNETEALVSNLQKERTNLRYIRQFKHGPAKARNQGVDISQGRVICFIDDDCTAEKNWVKLMVKAHQANPQAAAVGGLTMLPLENSSVMVSQFLSTCSIEYLHNRNKEVIFFPTCNVSFKREVLEKHRFDETFPLPGGEDLEFFWRIFKLGKRFIWDKGILVTHYRHEGLHSFIKQAYFYGRGNLLVKYMHPDHYLLHELEAGNLSFWRATLVNFIKIPRFSYILGKRLIQENRIKGFAKRFSIYLYFSIHKVFYLCGNISEYFRIKEIRPKLKSHEFIPRLLILDVTHSCNLTCKICDIWKEHGRHEDISADSLRGLLLEAKQVGIKEVVFSGGESLLRKDIFDLFEYARSIGLKNLGVLSNGILVKKYLQQLKPFLLDNTISLVISFDSLLPELHNSIRNSNSAWQDTRDSLKILSGFKKDYPQVNFNVITIILNQNLKELLDIANFVRTLGANSLQFQPLLPNNLVMSERKSSEFWIPDNKLSLLREAIDSLIKFKEENPDFIKNSVSNLCLIEKYYAHALTSADVQCLSASRTILISNQGEYRTCFSCYGDVKKHRLASVLLSSDRRKAQEKVRNCSWPCLLPCFCDPNA